MSIINDLWSLNNLDADTPSKISPIYKRINSSQKNISSINSIKKGESSIDSYQSMLDGKKLWQDTYQTKIEKTRNEYDSLSNGNFSTYQNDETFNEIQQSLNIEAQLKYLKLYFNSYMGNQNADSQWRLGNIKGYLNTDSEDSDTLVNNELYTRSDTSFSFNWDYLDEDMSINSSKRYYAAMSFPPYKFGSNMSVTDTLSNDSSDYTYDKETYSVNREYYTYRDIGMKTLSDYINFLQYIAEGATGIVSTYLTEWDLSVYIQEGMMTPQVNGGPMNIYLNYRIHEDNPFSDSTSNYYTDDTILSYNVCGSAVSKLFGDCYKTWRPSDYMHSSWWLPYIENQDYTIKSLELSSIGQTIKYVSIYDTLSSNFNYNGSNLNDIIKQQDYIGFVAGGKNRLDNISYYEAFYISADDGLSDLDIKIKNLLKKVSGADPEKSKSSGLDLNYLIAIGRNEMLLNGGLYGGPQSVNNNGGYLGRMAIQYALNNDSDEELTMSSMISKTTQSGSNDSINSTTSSSESSLEVSDFLSSKKDSSTMSDLTGINRWAPAIYGGPHGSQYSLYNLRSYFQENNILTRNIPKVEPFIKINNNDLTNISKYGLENDYKITNSDEYNDNSRSPIDVIASLKEGTYLYESKLAYQLKEVEEFIDADISVNNGKVTFTFPTTINGKSVTYTDSSIKYRIKYITTSNINNKLNKIFKFYKKFTKLKNGYIMKIPYRKAKYSKLVECCIKYYFIEDRPNLKWNIVLHKFESYKYSGNDLQSIISGIGLKNTSKSEKKYIKSLSPGYVLTLDNINEEKKFIREIIRYNRGLTDLPRYMWFIAANDTKIDKDGPEYMFRAPCYVRYYKNSTKIYTKYKGLFGWKKSYSGTQYTFMPYIYVDLDNCTEFYDNLRTALWTNDSLLGESIPLHISTGNYLTSYITNSVNLPIQKISKKYYHRMTAYEQTETETDNSFLGGLKTLLFGSNANGNYQNFGSGSILWDDFAYYGISGKGIISGWPGIDPYYNSSTLVVDSLNYTIDQSAYLKRSNLSNVKDIPIGNIPIYGATKSNSISTLETLSNIDWMLEGPIGGQTYKKVAFSSGLQKAINNINRMLIFYAYNKTQYSMLDLSVPYKNFLSWCIVNKNYLNILKNLISPMSFESLDKLLENNVDNCVLKACGLQKNEDGTTELIKKDSDHILYDYWIDVAIQMLYDKSSIKNNKNELLNKINEILELLQITIDYFTNILKKDSLFWTFNEICSMNYYIYNVKQKIYKINIIDNFMFMYLHILYNYRLYFIGKRFNKKNGTMWIMRALESTIDLISENTVSAKDPTVLDDNVNTYAVAFYEIQNKYSAKREALIANSSSLDEDKIYKIYVQVEYGKKSDYDAWIAYNNDPNSNPKVREVIKLVINNTENRYIFKPVDGLYEFRSKEFDLNYKNDLWNKSHVDQDSKNVVEYNNCIFNIEWKPTKECTPIRFNVFGNIDTNNLLVYSENSISAEDLMCLTEIGADFWTINIPSNLWPNVSLYKTGLYITKANSNSLENTLIASIGPFANTLSPIISWENL